MKDSNGIEVCPFCRGPLPCPHCKPPSACKEKKEVVKKPKRKSKKEE